MDVLTDCICSGKPHEQDTITLRDHLDFRQGKRIQNEILLLEEEQRQDVAFVLAVLTEEYILGGVEAWSVVDDKDKPVPVTRDTIREYLLSKPVAAGPVADAADELYQEAVMLPLLRRAQNSSPPTPTGGLTSAPTSSEPKRPKLLKQSSTSTTRTDGTVGISA